MRLAIISLPVLTVIAILSAACAPATPTDVIPNAPTLPNTTAATPATAVTAVTTGTPATNPPATPSVISTAAASYCPNGGAPAIAPGEAAAAKVNGEPIPLTFYQRQLAQDQAALVAQGVDLKSQGGQETLKGLQQQVLGQLIDDLLVEQAARQQNVTVNSQDVDNRVQQMIDDVNGRAQFDEWLKTNQMQLPDLCTQLRASIFGEIMLQRVTANIPTQAEQVHAAQILLGTKADADKVLALAKQGKDWNSLAKQYSKDESTRDNGGDLGWFPRGVKPPEFDDAVFKLQPGQLSDVVATSFGFHIIKLLERSPARDVAPEYLQVLRQQAFATWLDQQRSQAKIEKLVNP